MLYFWRRTLIAWNPEMYAIGVATKEDVFDVMI